MTTLQHISAGLFWACASLVLYTYCLYPVLIRLLARLAGRGDRAEHLNDGELPSVSLVIAAYNEEEVIGKRVDNALAMDYPREKLEVVIGSDGSTDATARIVRAMADPRVGFFQMPQRGGKASVLNAAIARLKSDIVILSDANTLFDSDAARMLVRPFVDPNVGAVCGRLVLTDSTTGRNVDGLYWRYETFLKKQEGRLGALLGSNGGIYAIRRRLFLPIPSNTIVDDFVIPLLSKLRTGCRIVYEAGAIAHEETAPDVSAEFRRRCRIGAGGWQAIGLLWPLLNPRHGWVAFTFFSHKLLRWLCPFLLIGMLLACAVPGSETILRVALVLQLASYIASMLVAWLPARFPFSRLLRVGNMFVLMNAALFVGFFRWLGRPKDGTWERTRRTAERAEIPASSSPTQPAARAVAE